MTALAVLLLIAVVLLGIDARDNARGEVADAEVIDTTMGERVQKSYTVCFTTHTGLVCESVIRHPGKSKVRAVTPGERVRIRYPGAEPCENADLKGGFGVYTGFFAFLVLFLVTAAAAVTLWINPDAFRRENDRP